jgi:hypothetical protein
MNNNIFKLLNGINQEDIDFFIEHTKSSLDIKKAISKETVDYSWIDIVYEIIPYLDNIIKNSINFINNEEENKKIIVLNKIEKNDLYEERFIFTLIKRLSKFISNKIENINDNVQEKIKDNVTFDANTKYNSKNIKVNVNLEVIEENNKQNEIIERYKERIENLNNIVKDYENSSFMKRLNEVSIVKSPIRKTNIIIKDKNLRKALELWEYLDNYELNEPILITTDTKESKSMKMCNKYTLIYYLSYLALINDEQIDKKESEELIKHYMSKLINDYIEDNNSSEAQFKSFINKEFKEAKKNKLKKENDIYDCFKSFYNSHEKRLKDALCNIQSDFKVDKENYML